MGFGASAQTVFACSHENYSTHGAAASHVPGTGPPAGCRSRHLKSAGQPPPVTASCRTASQNFKMGGESHITRGAPSGSPLRLDCQQPACTRSQHFRHAVDTMRDLHLLRNPSSLPSWIHEPESTLPGNGVALSFKRGCGKKKLMYLAGILKDGARLSVGMDLPPRAHSLYKATPVCASQALSAAVSALFVGRQLDAVPSIVLTALQWRSCGRAPAKQAAASICKPATQT